LAVVHKRLVGESAKIAKLTAQIEMHEELAQAREQFNKRMLAKDVELVQLQAALNLANERAVLNQKMSAAVAENVQLKASLCVAQSQTETLKHQTAQRTHDLEQQLEMLNVRLAEKPTEERVQ